MDLVFATHNPHKLIEIRHILGENIRLISLDDLGCHVDIPEPFQTLEENARSKTLFVREHYNRNCFADDTGLEIESLQGEPGVHSARYAAEESLNGGLVERFRANMEKVLHKMRGKTNRKACFRTVISLDLGAMHFFFEGTVNGQITQSPMGEGGFGYDPIFVPSGYSKTFAEMSLEEKSLISHRAIAFHKLKHFLDIRTKNSQ